METSFFKNQTNKLNQAFNIFEQQTSRNIRNLSPGECLEEFSNVNECKVLVEELLAAKELGADQQIAGIFATLPLI